MSNTTPVFPQRQLARCLSSAERPHDRADSVWVSILQTFCCDCFTLQEQVSASQSGTDTGSKSQVFSLFSPVSTPQTHKSMNQLFHFIALSGPAPVSTQFNEPLHCILTNTHTSSSFLFIYLFVVSFFSPQFKWIGFWWILGEKNPGEDIYCDISASCHRPIGFKCLEHPFQLLFVRQLLPNTPPLLLKTLAALSHLHTQQ